MLKRWLWAGVKPLLAAWLAERALRLPLDDAQRIARQTGMPLDRIRAANDALAARVLAELDRFVP